MVIQEMKITVKLQILHRKTLQLVKSLSLILFILGLAVALIFAFSWLILTTSQLPLPASFISESIKIRPINNYLIRFFLKELVSRNMLQKNKLIFAPGLQLFFSLALIPLFVIFILLTMCLCKLSQILFRRSGKYTDIIIMMMMIRI